MSTHLDICPSGKKAKNTGFDDQCLETKLKIPVLSNGFAFESVADFKNKKTWKGAIAAKRLVPLFEAYELADASTADKKFETGNFSKVTEKGVEKITFECMLSVCGYAALKSYEENGNYGEIFEFNEGEDYSGVFATDGVAVKGRKIKSLIVTRVRATKDKVPVVKCEIVFDDKDDILNAVIVKSDLDSDDLEGIHDVKLTLTSFSEQSAKLTAASGCGYDKIIKSLTLADFVVWDVANNTPVSASLIPVDPSTGEYELVFDSGAVLSSRDYTIDLNGVISMGDVLIESIEPLTFKIV